MVRPIAFVLLLVGAATAASAQRFDASRSAQRLNLSSSSTPQERTPATTPVISLPIAEYAKANGARVRQRGIIIGTDIAPNITFGLGFGDLKPRKSALSPEPQRDAGSRKSRNAALRLNVRF